MQRLQSKFLIAKLYRDVDSGLRSLIKGICAILKRAMSVSVTKFVVSCMGSLARFGVELIE